MSDETHYYAARAAEERDREAASDGTVAAVHAALAEKYEQLAQQSQLRPTLGTGWHQAAAR